MSTRVLIVEDEAIVAIDLSTRLSRQGFTVVAQAGEYQEAVTLAGQHRPDCVLMDVRLRGDIDGIETASEIYSQFRIPSVFLTAYTDEVSVKRAANIKAYAYLLKPFHEQELVIAIQLAMARHEQEIAGDQNRALLHGTLNSIQDAVLTVDSDLAVRFVNSAAAGLLGTDPRTVPGRDIGEIVHLLPPHEAPGPELGHRYTLSRSDGSEVSVDAEWTHLAAVEASEAEAVLVLRDVSAQQEYEQRLRAARDKAQAADHAKSDFLARVSHELRTPLNSIIGMTDLASQVNRDPKLGEFIGVAYASARHLNGLISDLLEFSAFEAGKIRLQSVAFSPQELLEQTTRAYAGAAQERGLRLALVSRPEIDCRALGDPLRVRQVLTNLIDNAIKYTDSGSVTVHAFRTTDGAYRFEVRDTGPGIDADQQEAIFDAFVRLQALDNHGGGVGLGLSIARVLVRAMRGDLGLSSIKGEGSTFWFTLPLERQQAPAGPVCNEAVKTLQVDDQLVIQALGDWAQVCGVTIESVQSKGQVPQIRCIGGDGQVLAEYTVHTEPLAEAFAESQTNRHAVWEPLTAATIGAVLNARAPASPTEPPPERAAEPKPTGVAPERFGALAAAIEAGNWPQATAAMAQLEDQAGGNDRLRLRLALRRQDAETARAIVQAWQRGESTT